MIPSTSNMAGLDFVCSKKAMVVLAWGSRSIRSVFFPRWAMAAARLIAVVVFPTPPF